MRFHTLILEFLILLSASAAARPGQTQDVYFRSTDGVFLFGALRVPEGKGPFPALLIIHGGQGGMEVAEVRDGADPASSSPTIREFAKRPWVLFSIDYRARALFGMEEEDVLAAFRYLQARPEVDAKRIAVWGGSLGGLMALRLAENVGSGIVCVATGSPFAVDPMAYFFAELSQPPLSALSEETKEAIRKRREWVVPFLPVAAGVAPADLKSRVKEKSILENAGKIECAALFVTSRRDVEVPHSMVQPLIDKLKALGKPVTGYVAEKAPHLYYLYPRGHEEEHIEARRTILDFLEGHLNPGP